MWPVGRAESNESASKAAVRISGAMAQLRAAVDRREAALLQLVTHHREATAKTLDLQRAHIDMLHCCVTTTLAACHSILTSQPQNGVGVVREGWGLLKHSSSIINQIHQVCGMRDNNNRTKSVLGMLPGHTASIVVRTSHIMAEVQEMDRRGAEEQRGAVVHTGSLQWKSSVCVGLATRSRLQLQWTDEAATPQPGMCAVQCEYTVVRLTGVNEAVVYCGKDKHCVVEGLEALTEYTFELRAVYEGGVQVVCNDAATVSTLTYLPDFTDVDEGVSVCSDADTPPHLSVRTRTKGFRYAISDVLSPNAEVYWRVSIKNTKDGWLFVGVIDNNTRGSLSYTSQSAYGWASSAYVFSGGVRCAGSWAGWTSGDEAVLRLDSVAYPPTLEMRHLSSRSIVSLLLPMGHQWRLHLCFYNPEDHIWIAPACERDWFD
eukprot:c2005_g1_i1.p1 GENE.c2005_g1_i1~~c2005_g1_i1.p1  ORF type:complete len:431 (+),score=86.56 c2005_g1_i1:521-1813(+)